MIIIGSVGATLIILAVLENKGKLSINHTVLKTIVGVFSVFGIWWGIEKIVDATLLYI